jgi:hypothetical protein
MGLLEYLRAWWRRLRHGEAGEPGGPYNPGGDYDRMKRAEAEIEAAAAEQSGDAGGFQGGGFDGGDGGGGGD